MKTPPSPFAPIHRQWIVFSLVALVLVFFVVGSLYDRRLAVTLQERDRLQRATLVGQAALKRNLKAINQSLYNVRTELARHVSPDSLNQQLRVIDEALPMIQALVVVDASGHVQAASRPEVRGLTPQAKELDYIRMVREQPNAGTLYMSHPFETQLGSYTIAATRMWVGPKGEFAGVVSAWMDASYFDSLLASVLYAPRMTAGIFHGDGTIFRMAPAEQGDLIGKNMNGPGTFFTAFKASGQASAVFSGASSLTGDERMEAIRETQLSELNMDHPLGVSVSQPLADVYASWQQDVGVVSGTTLAILLLAALGLSLHQARNRLFLAKEAVFKSRQQRAASVFTHAHEGIFITDAANTIIDVNDAFTAITGYSHDDAVGQNPRLLQSDRQDAAFFAALWHDLSTQGHWRGEIWNRHKDGTLAAHAMDISRVRDDEGVTTHSVALLSDITASKLHQSELEHSAHYDALTGLPNRLLLGQQLPLAMQQCQLHSHVLAVVYLDLDNLKTINDRFGHAGGDAVLIAVTERLQGVLCPGDLLARIGGDEFVAVLVNLVQPDDCLARLKTFLLTTAEPIALTSQAGLPPEVRVSTSMGVTFFPHDEVDAEVLLRHADQAMYLAKQAGKNRYHLFDVAHDAAIQSWQVAMQGIRAALVANAFVLYYQPKVNMRSGQVIGAEALIRWEHPERGLLLPGVFLPGIEDHPVSIALGEWVIDTALTQMATWQAQGLDLHVSVNIGGLQLQQVNFPERLGALLGAHSDVRPQCLRLEILETSALEDVVKVASTMRVCQALGVTFSLDDFGTGYSSLTYLKHLPAEMLKIDQSFVRNMTEQPGDLAIVQGVISLAHVFQREVIAEGVETRSHGDLLLSIGCDLAQGYGIARPMPAQDMPEWVLKWQAHATWTA